MGRGEGDLESTWYRDAVIYEVHVKAFRDSASDGIGDIRGLTSKLDYLRDLGVTAVWLLPFYPSPLRDDGYDISDYHGVYKAYGDMADFRNFLQEAHMRGIRVITELVINHTSDRHDWFQRARRAPPGSREREFYVWTEDPKKYSEARVIFKDSETSNWTWDPVAKAYYWHRFYSHQPDLNFDSPDVQKAVIDVMDFWLKLGVDGLRLDAVPYLYEREGTNCENLPETHGFLKKMRAHMDSKFKGRMLLAEANQWPSDAARYFGDGDECNMAFHFPLMPRMFMAIQMEDRFPIVDILEETPPIPEGCQWGIFLRNHDELTLEMVTDEERDYMYRAYAHDKQARLNLGIRRRLAPLLGNDRRKIELMNILLFTLPGTPVIYYGDEIGMGDNIYLGDRNGVRTPMQWNADMNAGFSRTNPQRLYLPVVIEPRFHYEVVNVENQEADLSSLLWWFRRVIYMRKQHRAFGRGSIEFVRAESEKVLAFVRRYENESMLVVANLSRKPQCVDLDLGAFEGDRPTEVMGGSVFPDVGKVPYRLTLGAYGYYVFSLAEKARPADAPAEQAVQLEVQRGEGELFWGRHKRTMETSVLPALFSGARWFGGKARRIDSVTIRDAVEIRQGQNHWLAEALVDIVYSEGPPETYSVPLGLMPDDEFSKLPEHVRPRAIARVLSKDGGGTLFDAGSHPEFASALMHGLYVKRAANGASGRFAFVPGPTLREAVPVPPAPSEFRPLGAEQSNNSFVAGEGVVLKLLRRVEEGVQPEVELGGFLTARGFPYTPAFLGHVEYQQEDREPVVVAVAESFVRNEGDAWKLFTTHFEDFAEKASQGQYGALLDALAPSGSIVQLARGRSLDKLFEVTGPLFRDNVRLLGKRTAEFHKALASDQGDPDFAPEPFGYLGLTSLAQSMLSAAHRSVQTLSRAKLSDPVLAGRLSALLSRKEEVFLTFEKIRTLRTDALRCRIHGDYHLGQVLFTGKDFVIVDYEGEPARPLGERRLKRSPLRDVAGMLRSFHYAAVSNLFANGGSRQYAQHPKIWEWAKAWYLAVASSFLEAYLGELGGSRLAPSDDKAIEAMLGAYLLEKALYELLYELNSRPDWVGVPMVGIEEVLGNKTPSPPSPGP
ncbi:MAG: maltose alpha-D-glucosyltransferase [Nitrososphaerota archaeon]|nr:maltose alpha-D-glucosyltransferase [Nitrososphaerota archaeon]